MNDELLATGSWCKPRLMFTRRIWLFYKITFIPEMSVVDKDIEILTPLRSLYFFPPASSVEGMESVPSVSL